MGHATGDGTLVDPLIGLRSSSFGSLPSNGPDVIQKNTRGVQATISDDNGGTGNNSRLELRVMQSGTYYITVNAVAEGTGTYRLVVIERDGSELSDEDHLSSPDTLGFVKADDRDGVTGKIQPAFDADWFRVYLFAGSSYEITLNGNTLADPKLVLFDPDGNFFDDPDNDYVTQTNATSGQTDVSDNDGGSGQNAKLRLNVHRSGNYYIHAEENGADATGTYTLTVTLRD